MTPQELRASILQQAIQGKLVEQHENDAATSVKSSFEGDISLLFDLPENWKWLSIKDVASVSTGLSFKKQDQRDSKNGSLRVLRGGNIGDDYKYHLYDDDVYVELEQFQTKYIQLLEGDVITPSVTSIEKMCKTGFVDRDMSAITAGGFVYIIRCIDRTVIDPKFLLYFISSAFNKEQCKPNIHKSGQAFYNLKKSGFVEQPICIPPVEEQKRIVAKLEEIIPLIDRYEAAWNKLEEFNKRFPGDMQKSILQLAIQGKLVEQRPEEGTGEELFQKIQAEKQTLIKAGKIKKEKPLPEIAEDEIPFDIPDTWKWVRFNFICAVLTCGYASTPTYVPKEEGIPFISAKNVKPYRFMPDDHNYISCELYNKLTQNAKPEKGDILLTRVGAGIGEAAIIDIDLDFAIYVSLTLIKLVDNHLIDNRYVLYWLNSPIGISSVKKNIYGKNASQGNLNVQNVRDFLIPLPPLAEQKRIVAKLEEILPLCDRLK